MNTKSIGKQGEKIAIGYLKGKGYKVLDRNFFFRGASGPKIAEIDIIAKQKDCFVFVEVKTLNKKLNQPFLAQDKVNSVKQRKIAWAAEIWLVKHKIPLDSKWRIDVVAIELLEDDRPKIIRGIFGPKTKISHFENIAFR
jgi:putative endonuclease